MAIIGHIFYMVYISIFDHKLSFAIMLYCLIKINDTFMTLQNGLTYIARELSHFCEKEYIHPLDIYKCLVFLIWRNSLSITSRKWTYNDAKVDSWSKRKISRKKRNLSFNLKHFISILDLLKLLIKFCRIEKFVPCPLIEFLGPTILSRLGCAFSNQSSYIKGTKGKSSDWCGT